MIDPLRCETGGRYNTVRDKKKAFETGEQENARLTRV